MSTIIDVGFSIKDTIEAINKHTQEVPDYKAMDNDILLIEKHTEIMKMVTVFFNRVTAEVSSFVKD